jgi:GT2 family glycosyltransferase
MHIENNEMSIIIVNWNTEALLRACLTSIFASSVSFKFEVIVVDNNSSDNSPDMVKNEFKHVKLIRNPDNYGFARANNIGIHESNGEFICIANSDTEIFPDTLETMMKYMRINHDIGILGPKLLNKDLSLQKSCKRFPRLWSCTCKALFLHRLFCNSPFFAAEDMDWFDHESISDVEAIAGAFLLLRRHCFERVGFFDERFWFYEEDIDLCCSSLKNGYRNVYFPTARVVHLGGSSSIKLLSVVSIYLVKSRLLYIQKHFSPIKALSYRGIMIIDVAIRSLVLFVIQPLSTSKKNKGFLPVLEILLGIIKV